MKVAPARCCDPRGQLSRPDGANFASATWRVIRYGPEPAGRRPARRAGGRDGRGRGDDARDCELGGEVGDEPVEVGPRLGRGGLLHPLAELFQLWPPVFALSWVFVRVWVARGSAIGEAKMTAVGYAEPVARGGCQASAVMVTAWADYRRLSARASGAAGRRQPALPRIPRV